MAFLSWKSRKKKSKFQVGQKNFKSTFSTPTPFPVTGNAQIFLRIFNNPLLSKTFFHAQISKMPYVLMSHVFEDPRSWQMDGRVISTHKGSWSSRYTCKKASGQGVRTHPPMVLLAMVRERNINQLAFYQVLKSYQEDPPLLRANAYIYSFRVLFLSLMVRKYFMMGCGP